MHAGEGEREELIVNIAECVIVQTIACDVYFSSGIYWVEGDILHTWFTT